MPTIETVLIRLTSTDGSVSLAGALPTRFVMAKAGPYPLARHAPLPGSTIGGEVLLELNDLSWGPVDLTALAANTTGHELTVTLAAAELTGAYLLFGLESPDIDLDVGGALAPLSVLAAEADSPAEVTPKQFDQLMQANAQRERLRETSNGRQMLDGYDKYNDDYNEVFKNNRTLRTKWLQGGATQAMMDHTSRALDDGGMINPPAEQQTFGTQNIGYNANALQQWANVVSACTGANKPDAALAATSFSSIVDTDTGNSGKKTTAMTGEDVYGRVADSSPAPNVNVDQPQPSALHLALTRYLGDQHSEDDMALLADHGLHATALEGAREVYADAKRVHEPANRISLHSGPVSAPSGVSTFRYRLTEQPDGAVTVTLVQTSLVMDELNVGAANWPGDLGAAPGSRARSASFVRGILEDRVASALTRTLRRLARESA